MQAGGDLVNLVKQYNEFKLRDKGVGLAVGLMFLTDIHSLDPGRAGRHHLHRRLVLELRPAEPGVRRPVPGQDDRDPADLRARGQLLGGDAVPGGGAGGRHRRRRRRASSTLEGTDGQRRLPAQRQDPGRGPPGRARRVPGPGEADRPRSRRLGLREDPQDHPGGRGVPRRRRAGLQAMAADHGIPPAHASTAWSAGQLLRAARARPGGHLRDARGWSTSPTARSTCSARSARTSCSTELGVHVLAGAAGGAAGAGRARAWCWSGPWSTGWPGLDPLYNFLLTFGLTLILQDLVKPRYGVAVQPYRARRPALAGSVDLGLFDFPAYRVFVLVFAVVVCVGGVVAAHPDPGRHGGAGGHRAARADPGARHQRGPLGDPGLRLRHRAGRAGRGARRADAGGQPADGRATSSSSSSRWW